MLESFTFRFYSDLGSNRNSIHASLPVSKRSFVLDLDRSNATFVFFICKNAHFAMSWWQSQYLGASFADWIHLVSTSQSKLPFHWSGFHMDLISIRIPLKAKWSKKELVIQSANHCKQGLDIVDLRIILSLSVSVWNMDGSGSMDTPIMVVISHFTATQKDVKYFL